MSGHDWYGDNLLKRKTRFVSPITLRWDLSRFISVHFSKNKRKGY